MTTDRRRSRRRPSAEVKVCAGCGREMAWRRSWERTWDEVRWCSDACRRRGIGELDQRIERAILDLLGAREHGATICPSEAARAAAPQGWRDELERTRRAARRLVADGRIEIVRAGRVVDPSTARGPIRLRAVRRPER